MWRNHFCLQSRIGQTKTNENGWNKIKTKSLCRSWKTLLDLAPAMEDSSWSGTCLPQQHLSFHPLSISQNKPLLIFTYVHALMHAHHYYSRNTVYLHFPSTSCYVTLLCFYDTIPSNLKSQHIIQMLAFGGSLSWLPLPPVELHLPMRGAYHSVYCALRCLLCLAQPLPPDNELVE